MGSAALAGPGQVGKVPRRPAPGSRVEQGSLEKFGFCFCPRADGQAKCEALTKSHMQGASVNPRQPAGACGPFAGTWRAASLRERHCSGSAAVVNYETLFKWPCGLMDKALVFGTKDYRFESSQGHWCFLALSAHALREVLPLQRSLRTWWIFVFAIL